MLFMIVHLVFKIPNFFDNGGEKTDKINVSPALTLALYDVVLFVFLNINI